jgi:carboxypeptidase T
MKKIKIIVSFIIVGMFFVPCLPAMPIETNQMLLLETVREQRLNGLQNPVQISQTIGLYHTYDEMTSLLFGLAANHSDIMSVSSIGKTYEGRDLWMVKLSDNVNQQEGEPEILFMGAHHGNEKSSYEVCLYFIQYMVEHYDNSSTLEVRESINATQIYVLPMVNPDGVEAGERKNREPNHGFFGFRPQVTSYGVDLNRNYANHWFLLFLLPQRFIGSTSWIDSSEVYRGPRPFSTEETQAVKQFVDDHHIKISISYHSFGELVLYPWGYTAKPPKDKSLFVSIGENISRFNHYLVTQSIRLYPTLGDSCDWMYGTHGVFAFTIELGTTYAPQDPDTLRDICVNHTSVNLYITQRAQIL